MALNPLNSSNLEQLVLKGLKATRPIKNHTTTTTTERTGNGTEQKTQESTEKQVKLDSLRLFSQRCSLTPHFFWGEVRTRAAMTANSNSAEIFVQCTYPQVLSSYVYLFGSYRVDKQTNKQTPLKTSNALRYATTLVNKSAQSNLGTGPRRGSCARRWVA